MNKRRVFLIPVIALLLAFCAVQIGCKSKKSDDSFTDERDGNTYKTVKIGEFGQLYWDGIAEIKTLDRKLIPTEFDICPDFVYLSSLPQNVI